MAGHVQLALQPGTPVKRVVPEADAADIAPFIVGPWN